MSDTIIGIDLGTTNSMAAVVTEKGVEIIENEEISSYTPSMVTIKASGILVGTESKDQRLDFPDKTFYSFKRFMGRGSKDIREDLSQLPFPVSIGERDNILLGPEGMQFSPEQVSAEILRHIKTQSEKILDQKIDKAVITVPAYFDDAQRQATRDAAAIAGLEAVRILNEPTAAAIAYGLDEKKKGKVAVYDFGGGTFDISILDLKGKIFKVLSTNGNTHLGGDDLDYKVIDAIKAKLSLDGVTLNSDDIQYLKKIAEEIKVALTGSLEIEEEIKLPQTGETLRFLFNREDLNKAIEPNVSETIDHVKHALSDAGLTAQDIDEVVMVGGSTRIPLVRSMIADFFGKAPHVNINPDEVVAIGAGTQAHLLAGGRRDFLLMDVIPLSLGIETIGGTFSKLVMKNGSIPAQATETFSTSVDNQTGVDINVFQGEREFVADCRLLGKFKLKGIPPMPAGLPRVEVTFLVDANGILTVTAKELRSNVEASIEIIPAHGLKRTEVTRMVRESMEFALEDFKNRNLAEFRVTAQSVITGLEKVWDKADAFLNKEQQDEILKHKEVLKLIAEGDDPDLLKAAIDHMGNLTREFADAVMGDAARGELTDS